MDIRHFQKVFCFLFYSFCDGFYDGCGGDNCCPVSVDDGNLVSEFSGAGVLPVGGGEPDDGIYGNSSGGHGSPEEGRGANHAQAGGFICLFAIVFSL